MEGGGLSKRLANLGSAAVGHITGGFVSRSSKKKEPNRIRLVIGRQRLLPLFEPGDGVLNQPKDHHESIIVD